MAGSHEKTEQHAFVILIRVCFQRQPNSNLCVCRLFQPRPALHVETARAGLPPREPQGEPGLASPSTMDALMRARLLENPKANI